MAALVRRLRFATALTAVGPRILAAPPRRALKLDPEEELEKLSIAKRSLCRADAEPTPSAARPPPPEARPSTDIGLPYRRRTASRQQRLEHWTERRKLEPLARQRKLVVDVAEAERDCAGEWGPEHARTVAEHYALYAHLFRDNVHFYPVVGMRVCFDLGGDAAAPVFRGNRLLPAEARSRPTVSIVGGDDGDAAASSTYSLVLTSLDGHLTEPDGEYLHWFVGNITNGKACTGQELCSYLQPIPPRGTGFHRYVFLLFKHQEGNIDFSDSVPAAGKLLSDRSFSTAEFFRRHEGKLVPAGLNFFQCQWDDSVRQTFYDVLDMKEPAYEYDFPEPYHPKQVVYPHKQPFNLYLDRYRDRKEIREQALKERLKRSTPQQGERDEWRYPLAVPYRRAEQPPTWLELQNYNRRARRNLWRYAYEED